MGYAGEQRAQARARRIQEQQQVRRALQQGEGIRLYSANPLEAAVQRIGSAFGIMQPPYAGRDPRDSNRLLVSGGSWQENRSALPGNVNVAGRTWDLAQQGDNTVYIPRGATTRFNSIAPTSQQRELPRDLPQQAPAGSTPAAERAYQTEKSRVAQLTAQDPELKRYEDARTGAKTQEDMNAARDIGMQIWRQKYGNTPMGQPGGAVGAYNPLMQDTFGYQSGSAPDQQMGEPTLGPSPLIPQIDQSLNPASPNFIGGEGPPLMNFADPRFENMSPDEFQKLLNQVNKK